MNMAYNRNDEAEYECFDDDAKYLYEYPAAELGMIR
jgi:hypothetical protein